MSTSAIQDLCTAFEAFLEELQVAAVGTRAAPDDEGDDQHHHHEHNHAGVGTNHRHEADGEAIDEADERY